MSYFEQAAAQWDTHPERVKLMRAVGEAIVRQAALTPTMRVLDYGCGTGLVGLYLLPHVCCVTGADNSPAMLAELDKKIAAGGLSALRTVLLDLEKDSPPADRYDRIVVSMAMHHIAEVGRVLGAFYRLLQPGGMVCIADLDSEPGTFHPAAAMASVHHKGFDRSEMKFWLEQAGFADVSDSTAARFRRPIESGGEGEFSVFLMTATRR